VCVMSGVDIVVCYSPLQPYLFSVVGLGARSGAEKEFEGKDGSLIDEEERTGRYIIILKTGCNVSAINWIVYFRR
jgi:hypothetical protein